MPLPRILRPPTIQTHTNSRIFRALTVPTVAHSCDIGRVAPSIFNWRPCEEPLHLNAPPGTPKCYRLTPLGVLHTLIGLRLQIVDEEPTHE